jgi:hypothetical protein
MQIEKKLILCSILAISIGIATIAPLVYFMSPATAQTTDDKPWFNLNVSYATCKVATQFSQNTAIYSIASNYTINSDAVDTQVGSRLEYYRIQIYSDQGQLVNETQYIAVNCTEFLDPTSIQFAREGWFNTTGIIISSGTFAANFNGTLQEGNGGGSTWFGYSDSNEASQQIENIQNAQTIYVDVHRLGYITSNGNSTVVTFAGDEIIQHLELTKNGDQFVYGTEPPYGNLK